MKTKTKRCSRCGKKIRLLKDGTIASHQSQVQASKVRYMSRPDLDDYVITAECTGSYELPHKGRWYGKVGWRR
jgi:hypothetical protein